MFLVATVLRFAKAKRDLYKLLRKSNGQANEWIMFGLKKVLMGMITLSLKCTDERTDKIN